MPLFLQGKERKCAISRYTTNVVYRIDWQAGQMTG